MGMTGKPVVTSWTRGWTNPKQKLRATGDDAQRYGKISNKKGWKKNTTDFSWSSKATYRRQGLSRGQWWFLQMHIFNILSNRKYLRKAQIFSTQVKLQAEEQDHGFKHDYPVCKTKPIEMHILLPLGCSQEQDPASRALCYFYSCVMSASPNLQRLAGNPAALILKLAHIISAAH